MAKKQTPPDESKTARKAGTIAAVAGGVIILVLTILLLLPSDTFKTEPEAPDPTPPAAAEQTPIESTAWKLVTFLQNGISTPLPENTEVTLVIEGADFSGVSGCNNYFGSYTVQDPELQTIVMGPIGSTRKACSDDSVMTFENEYLTTLQDVASFRTFEDTGLTLYSGVEGNTALSFEKKK